MDKGAYPGHSIEKIQLIQVTTEENMPHVRQLFLEYAQWLHGKAAQAHGASFDVVSVTRMFVEESGEFYPPYGRLYLAKYKDDIVGVGCLKRQGRGIGEIKRMYVRPAYRRKGIGKVILEQLIRMRVRLATPGCGWIAPRNQPALTTCSNPMASNLSSHTQGAKARKRVSVNLFIWS